MMAVAPASIVATKASALVASGAAMPAFIITEQVQLAIVAGVFNLVLNAMTLYYSKRNRDDAKDLKQTAQKNSQRIAETHDIVERRQRKRDEHGR